MFSNPWTYLILLGLVIIVVLAVIATKLMLQLKQQKRAQAQLALAQQTALKKHDLKVLDSVIIIVRAMKEKQCDIAEGCWRLSVLLDSLKLNEQLSTKFPSIFALYNGIKHMPIREERKKLAKQERMKLDLARMKLEAELEDAIYADIENLHQFAEQQQQNYQQSAA